MSAEPTLAPSPLGPVEAWPSSLRTVLSLLLARPEPGIVLWGPGLVPFPNDAARPLMGAGLGRVLGPWASAVLASGESTTVEDLSLSLEREGHLEETCFRLTCSPVREDVGSVGSVGGVFVTCTETTARVLGERRLRTLSELRMTTSHPPSAEDVGRAVSSVLSVHRHDIPFALLYLADAWGQARLVGSAGVEPASAAAPLRLDSEDPAAPWPWAAVRRMGKDVELETLPAVPGGFPGGPWPEPARAARAHPLFLPGQDTPAGMWVAGLSPRRPLDAATRDFLSLAAMQLSHALGQALAHRRPLPPTGEPTGLRDEAHRGGPGIGTSLAESPLHEELPRILLVEDNAEMRTHVRRLLAERWAVEAVDSAEEALRICRERPPQLILSDVVMPGMDGFALLRALRANPHTAAVPVILLSARAGEEASLEAHKAGADDYLVKPFSSRELLARISARLEAARVHESTRMERAWLYSRLMLAPVAICVVSGPEFRFELANPLYLEMVGRAHLAGRMFREAFAELPDDAPVFQMMRQVYLTGEPFTAREFPLLLSRDGRPTEEHFFLFTCQPMPRERGGELDIMTVAVDVTAQVLARREVERLVESERALRDRAEEADRRKDEFLAMLAHELRNPLAALSTALEVMGHAWGDTARLGRLRDTGVRQVGNLVRMVDDLLDVSRVTRGKLELRRAPVDFASLVRHALSACRPMIEARAHTLSVAIAPGDFPMEADATRLEQVVANLLTNAARYTPSGGSIQLSVERGGAPEGPPRAVLRVRDTGQGITPGLHEKLFELFFQEGQGLDRAGGGLGIGLTLVRRLVDMHGGRVSAHSEGPGRGSEFVVELPLSASGPPASGPSAPASSSAPPGTLEDVPDRLVLVVEDSEDMRDLMREFLEELGLRVEVAADGLEGVARVLALRPELAFVDVGLPGIDGYEVARRVRASPGGDAFFLVALTGYGGADAKRSALEAGFDLHLVKPINVMELPRVLDAARAKAGRS